MEAAKNRPATPFAAGKPPFSGASSVKKMKQRRRVLADLTNSDSPIAGLTPAASAASCEAGSSSPGTPGAGTPGIGEDLLRSQVNLLLQQVQADAPRGPLFGYGLPLPLSPGMLVGPTPANTPAAATSQPTTPVVAVPSSKSRLSKALQDSDSSCIQPCADEHDLEEEGWRDGQEMEILFGCLERSEDTRLRRTISDISKITIAETVVSERHICLADRYITRSLDFDSLLKDMSAAEAADSTSSRQD